MYRLSILNCRVSVQKGMTGTPDLTHRCSKQLSTKSTSLTHSLVLERGRRHPRLAKKRPQRISLYSFSIVLGLLSQGVGIAATSFPLTIDEVCSAVSSFESQYYSYVLYVEFPPVTLRRTSSAKEHPCERNSPWRLEKDPKRILRFLQ